MLDHLLITGPRAGIRRVIAEAARDAHQLKTFWSVTNDTYHLRRLAELPSLTDDSVCPITAPHHTVSVAAMVGTLSNGYRFRPGQLSLAHGGILFLDDALEFSMPVMAAVIDALANQEVRIDGGTKAHVTAPAAFRLIAFVPDCHCEFASCRHQTSQQLSLLRRSARP